MDNNINMGNNAPVDMGQGSNSTKTIITIIIIVVLAVIGFFYFRNKPATEVVPTTNTATVKLNADEENAAALEKEASNIDVGDTGKEFNAIDENLKGI